MRMSFTVCNVQLRISLRRRAARSGSYPELEPEENNPISVDEAGRRPLTSYLPTARVLPLGWMFRLGRYPREL